MAKLINIFYLLVVLINVVIAIDFSRNAAKGGTGRIIGGASVTAADVPYQLQLEWDNWQICGASIISNFFALTSASCVDGFDQRQLTLRAAAERQSSGGRLYQVYRINMHPNYDDYYKDYDVAVLELATPFRLDTTTKIIPLATTEPQGGSIVRASGFGRTEEEGSNSYQLLAVDIPVFPRANCTVVYAGDITARMICAGLKGKDACQGDTGGPLTLNGVQVGITSWSYGCARDGYPGVYTNIANSEIRSFINGIINA